METKWLCILFVLLILVAFSPGPEAALNAPGRRRRGNGIKPSQRTVEPLRVSRFISTCLPHLLTCLFALVSNLYLVSYGTRFVKGLMTSDELKLNTQDMTRFSFNC